MPRSDLKDLSGKVFGGWTVISLVAGGRSVKWLCRCVCDETRAVRACHLVSGASTNCGCLADAAHAERRTTHGMSRTDLYKIWTGMLQRCYNPRSKPFPDYGARGIQVCDAWRDSFGDFYKDMSPRPKGLTLERIDNDGNYAPENCRWATRTEQCRNSRHVRWIEFQEERRTLGSWAKHIGITQQALLSRLKKYPLGVALTLKPGQKGP